MLAGAFLQETGAYLPRVPLSPRKRSQLIVMIGVRIKPETARFLDLLSQQDGDTVSGTARRILEHFQEQWKAEVKRIKDEREREAGK